MKKSVILMAAASVLMAGTALAGPSAKFAATYDDRSDNEAYFNVVSIIGAEGTEQAFACNQNDGYQFATIKVPQQKELLVGLSAEVILITDTSIKGKEGGYARALAYAAGYMTIMACPVDGGDCVTAAPGSVTLADRFQILDGVFGGVLEECTDLDGDGSIGVPEECTFSDESLGLILDTLSSHHFNFVLPDMEQGEYDIKAMFSTAACNEITTEGDASAATFAGAAFGKYMLTVQQVRATKGGIIEAEIIE